MQKDQPPYPKKAGPPFAPAFGVLPPAAKSPIPFNGVELQPSEVCPKNFVILDQTCQRSQIMFHPSSAHKFGGPSLNFCTNYIQEIFERKDVADMKREISSSLKEDSDDINALLSLEEEEEENYDDEEVSTARTVGNYRSNSPDSVSSYTSRHQKNKSSSKVKSLCSTSNSDMEPKQQKMKKMVKVLRGIVPGGDHMNTVDILDEAVKYLKSLKVEVQKLGVGNFKN